MKKISVLLLVIMCLFSCAEKTEAEKKAEKIAFEIETSQKYPSTFLEVEGTYRKRILHDGYEINMDIKNTSEYTDYKDIEIQVSYISKTNTTIKTELTTIYEVLKKNSTIKSTIKPKFEHPDVKTLNIRATGATPIFN
ncbi:hypothetical protein GWK08_08855 [Leptobacterium flavescens]|uniref:Lipoprotein n=1 Tax=Leptobacterium flavescens TaxID=472055 RepID=A0A6P0URQ2_9FLAO|nr:hypothetical protein [Leptobacterium flavescens]NER13543.1 hypothetical protein [Leptobacterium flavescens]